MRQYKDRLHFQNQASVKSDLSVMSKVTENQMLKSWTFMNWQCSGIAQPYCKNIYSACCKPHSKLHKTDGHLIEKHKFVSQQ